MNRRKSVLQLFHEVAQRRRLRPWERQALRFFKTPASYVFMETYSGEDAVYGGVMPKSPGSAAEDSEEEKSRRLLSRIKSVLDESEDDSIAMRKLRSMLAELEAEDEQEDEDDSEDERTDEAEGRRPGVDDEPESVSVGWRGARVKPITVRSGRADEAAREFRSSYRRAREASRGIQRDATTGF